MDETPLPARLSGICGGSVSDANGRMPGPWYKKINPIWWIMNDDEQTVDAPDAKWYHPEWPHWRRWLYWNAFRNPLQNFRCYVIGIQDRNYSVVGQG
jgi:hypothetical protein